MAVISRSEALAHMAVRSARKTLHVCTQPASDVKAQLLASATTRDWVASPDLPTHSAHQSTPTAAAIARRVALVMAPLRAARPDYANTRQTASTPRDSGFSRQLKPSIGAVLDKSSSTVWTDSLDTQDKQSRIDGPSRIMLRRRYSGVRLPRSGHQSERLGTADGRLRSQ
jgi:hypothetical protein